MSGLPRTTIKPFFGRKMATKPFFKLIVVICGRMIGSKLAWARMLWVEKLNTFEQMCLKLIKFEQID
jgi:hypothetical protein